MIEAFEIGISLALADGVAEGIARAQKEADAVARAVAAGTVSVERLRQAGLAALTVVQPARQVSTASGAADLRMVQPATQPSKASGTADVLTAEAKQSEEAGAARPSEGAASLLERARDDPGAPSAVGIVLAGKGWPPYDSGPVASVASRPEGMELAPPPSQAGHSAPVQHATSHVVAGILPTHAYPGAPMPAKPDDHGRGARAGGALVVPAGAGSDAGRLAGLRLDDYGRQGGNFPAGGGRLTDQQGGPAAPAGSEAEGASEGATTFYAPVFTDPGNIAVAGPAKSAAVQLSRTADADASGGGASQPGAPAQGDVFLDGSLVGRWMSRHLNREAGRASAGPTGFDPRRNALLPGPTVGG